MRHFRARSQIDKKLARAHPRFCIYCALDTSPRSRRAEDTMHPDEKFEIFISVCTAFFHHKFQEIFSRDPMDLPARARAHGPRDRASFSGMLSARAPFQSARSRRRQPAEIRRRDRRMAPRGAVLRPRRFPPERCRGCPASWDLVIGEAGRSAGAKATAVARTSYTEHKESDA